MFQTVNDNHWKVSKEPCSFRIQLTCSSTMKQRNQHPTSSPTCNNNNNNYSSNSASSSNSTLSNSNKGNYQRLAAKSYKASSSMLVLQAMMLALLYHRIIMTLTIWVKISMLFYLNKLIRTSFPISCSNPQPKTNSSNSPTNWVRMVYCSQQVQPSHKWIKVWRKQVAWTLTCTINSRTRKCLDAKTIELMVLLIWSRWTQRPNWNKMSCRHDPLSKSYSIKSKCSLESQAMTWTSQNSMSV